MHFTTIISSIILNKLAYGAYVSNYNVGNMNMAPYQGSGTCCQNPAIQPCMPNQPLCQDMGQNVQPVQGMQPQTFPNVIVTQNANSLPGQDMQQGNMGPNFDNSQMQGGCAACGNQPMIGGCSACGSQPFTGGCPACGNQPIAGGCSACGGM